MLPEIMQNIGHNIVLIISTFYSWFSRISLTAALKSIFSTSLKRHHCLWISSCLGTRILISLHTFSGTSVMRVYDAMPHLFVLTALHTCWGLATQSVCTSSTSPNMTSTSLYWTVMGLQSMLGSGKGTVLLTLVHSSQVTSLQSPSLPIIWFN